jgi:glycosyltransferase involved in cell wall biosynthesis
MKLLFVSPYYKPYLGGIERVIEKLSLALIENNDKIQVSVLTSRWSFPRKYCADWPPQEVIDNTEVYRLNSWPRIAPPFFQVPLVWFSPTEINKTLDVIRPDAVVLMSDRWFWVNFWVLKWARRNQIPVVFSLSFHELSRNQWFLRPLNWLLTRMARHVQVITQHERELVHRTYQTPLDKIVVIPWGADLPSSEFKEKLANPTVIKIIAIGRISQHKGQKWLAETYLTAQFKQPTELRLIGEIEDRAVADDIKKLEVPVDKSIVLTGKVSDEQLNDYYNSADLFALFPEYEAFGLVFLEAMALGVPVITHNVGAVQEVLGDNAIVTKAYDRTQACDALEKLVNDPVQRKNYAAIGAQYTRNNFAWSKTATKFLELFSNTGSRGTSA